MPKIEKETPVIATEDDPRRCQAMANGSQCKFISVPNGNYCHFHGGNAIVMSTRRKEIYDLNKTKYLQDFRRMSENSFWRSNRDEVGILRVTLQNILDKCQTENDIFVNASKISDIVTKINKLLETSLKIDEKLKSLISEEKMYEIAQYLVDAVFNRVNDPIACEEIAREFETILLGIKDAD